MHGRVGGRVREWCKLLIIIIIIPSTWKVWWRTELVYFSFFIPSQGLCYQAQGAKIDFSCTSDTSTLETYYSNFIAMLLYVQKCLMYKKIQYCRPGPLLLGPGPLLSGINAYIDYGTSNRGASINNFRLIIIIIDIQFAVPTLLFSSKWSHWHLNINFHIQLLYVFIVYLHKRNLRRRPLTPGTLPRVSILDTWTEYIKD